MQYSIFEDNMPRLERKLVTIKKKCKKYGLPFEYNIVGDEFKAHCYIDNAGEAHKETLRYVIVEVSGTAIVNDWKFVAAIEHTSNGNIIKCVDSTVEVPAKYYNSKGYCEHCGTKRNRHFTSLVMNVKTGEFKQIGKSCVTEYTHGMSAEYIASYIAMYDELIEGQRVYGSGYERYVDIKDYLQYVVECINCWGFFKANAEYSTKQRAWNYMFPNEYMTKEMNAAGFMLSRDGNKKLVADAINWLNEQEANTAYMHDLKVIVANKYVKYGEIGILASLIPTYEKNIKIERERAAQLKSDQRSEYVGEVGNRIKIDIKDVAVLTSWDNCYGGYYQVETKVYKITDVNNNIFIWKTSSFIGENDKYIIGTIKEHSEYKGVKQTVLTRCKVA